MSMSFIQYRNGPRAILPGPYYIYPIYRFGAQADWIQAGWWRKQVPDGTTTFSDNNVEFAVVLDQDNAARWLTTTAPREDIEATSGFQAIEY